MFFQRSIREVVFFFFQVIEYILHKESVLQVSVCGEGAGTYDLAARYTNWKGTICRAGCIRKILPLYGEGSLADLEKAGIPARNFDFLSTS